MKRNLINHNGQKHILVADGDLMFAKTLGRLLLQEGFDVISVNSGEEAYNKAIRQQLDLMILEATLPGMDDYKLCRRLRQNPAVRSVPILMLTAQGDTANKIAGFEAGVDDFLVRPFEAPELIYRAKGLMSRAHSNGSTESEPQSKSGQVIAVFGTKGGVGKTLIAANLAVALRRQSGKRVALFDADFYFGDVGVHPNLPASRGMLDLIEHIDELKPELAEHFLVLHDSGVRVLLSPFQPEDAELITAEHVHKTLEFLAQTYDYTIVDCHSSYDDCMLMVLEHADEIMLIVTPEIGSLKNTVLFLELISKMGLATTSVRIILNRAKSVEGIATKEVENMLRRPVAFHIASGGRSVVSSVNRGTPLTLKQADHPFAHQIRRMSQCLIAS